MSLDNQCIYYIIFIFILCIGYAGVHCTNELGVLYITGALVSKSVNPIGNFQEEERKLLKEIEFICYLHNYIKHTTVFDGISWRGLEKKERAFCNKKTNRERCFLLSFELMGDLPLSSVKTVSFASPFHS